jgi:hypothetical protein
MRHASMPDGFHQFVAVIEKWKCIHDLKIIS